MAFRYIGERAEVFYGLFRDDFSATISEGNFYFHFESCFQINDRVARRCVRAGSDTTAVQADIGVGTYITDLKVECQVFLCRRAEQVVYPCKQVEQRRMRTFGGTRRLIKWGSDT